MFDGREGDFSVLLDILNGLRGMFYRCKYDKDWTVTYITEGCRDLIGYAPSELLFNYVTSYGAIIHPGDYQKVSEICGEAIDNQRCFVLEYRIIDKNGITKTVWERGSAIYGTDGTVKYIEGYITDANDFKDKEELNNELLLFRNAIDINTICTVTDREGTIIYANQKACEVSGYSEQELLGANHRILKSGHHPTEFYANLWKTIASGNIWKGEIKNCSKNKEYYWVDTIIIPIKNAKGIIHKYLSLRTVITDKKIAEEQVSLYMKNMEQMLFMISHELRKPLATCQGLINLLEGQKDLKPGDLQTIMHGIQGNICEIDLFTRKLTDFIHDNKIRSTSENTCPSQLLLGPV